MIQTNTIIDDLVIEEVGVYKICDNRRKSKFLCFNILDHKVCYSCKQLKNHSEFHRQKSSKDGRYYECKECSKLKNPKDKEFSRQAKIDMVNYMGKKCIRCDYSYPEGIDFHHIDPSTKKFDFGRCPTRYPLKNQKYIDELHKCVPLCKNCHAEFHTGRYTLEQYLHKLPKFNENIQKQDFTGNQLILGFQIGCSD
jgi:hypothetical protein